MRTKSRKNPYRAALKDLVETICDAECYGDIEGGCDGNGPLVRALRLLRQRRPDSLAEWLSAE